jgi:choline-sulfatase
VVDWLKRLVFSLAGGAGAALLVAAVEARSVAAFETGSHVPSYGALALADLGVLAPLALVVAMLVGVALLALEPDRQRAPEEHIASLRAQPVLTRSRTAALAPLIVVTGFAWCVATAHIAEQVLANGAPLEAGATLAVASLATLAALSAIALALLPPLRRGLAALAARWPRALDPATTAGIALGVVAAAFAWGVHAGDTGGGGKGVLAIFGVLKRQELDLRPVVNLGAIAMGAYLAPIALAPRAPARRAVLAAVLVAAALGVTAHEAFALNEAPAVARDIQRNAPLGRIGLALARRATDRDRDGASALFAGGDCDDLDPLRNPTRIDVPGNGIDEDCSGDDLALLAPLTIPGRARPTAARLRPDMNLVLITVDTMSIDLGFMGYPMDVSPNLDRLAAQSVVFDRAYSMASYTGKSVGPLLIGKYPSETRRDGGHFNAYYGANTFIAERFRNAGIRTMGAASHWYFVGWSGLTQGIDTWDMSARPSSGQGDNDTSVTSEQLSDAALRLLGSPESASGRFFMWLHYFDPHEQYVAHPDSPDFLPEHPTFTARQKAAYVGEIWFTDKHIGRVLDFIASQPWGERTVIVVTSDHGEAFADHNMNFHGVEIWETLVRVPLIIHVPGLVPHHVPVKRSHIDLAPTLVELMGLPVPDPGEMSGQSLVPDLTAKPGDAFEERDVYIDMPVGPYTAMRRAVISGETPGLKLIHFGGNQYSLFDLAADPGEKNDLVTDRSKFLPMLQRLNRMRARVKEIDVPPVMPADQQPTAAPLK